MRQILLEFVEAINNHNTEKIAGLLLEDHVFIDSLGIETRGKDTMERAWVKYFEMFPDYKIDVKELLNEANRWYMFGFASGTYGGENPQNFWLLPAAWKAVIDGDKIKLWQVYSDTKILFDIIGENS